ncbi:uncharacterized protein EAF01_000483 [Botrytis porri]|uniref:uncharacterized protein n=1 Tax=Botrytis porri TaxID=87229 RepID=UPI0019023A74|nr:uncharacterized protein EAF01_000483 [Botrytis porri]KAF7914077.1 hypothetical protein EAF01_000483 [Botrytis porri]
MGQLIKYSQGFTFGEEIPTKSFEWGQLRANEALDLDFSVMWGEEVTQFCVMLHFYIQIMQLPRGNSTRKVF